jgi:hypothetical protein
MKARVGLAIVVAAMLAVPATAGSASASVCDLPCQAVQGLDNLRGLTPQVVPQELQTSFIAKIDAAEASVPPAHYKAALNQVDALSNELAGAVQGGLIPVNAYLVEYQLLISAIVEVLGSIGL